MDIILGKMFEKNTLWPNPHSFQVVFVFPCDNIIHGIKYLLDQREWAAELSSRGDIIVQSDMEIYFASDIIIPSKLHPCHNCVMYNIIYTRSCGSRIRPHTHNQLLMAGVAVDGQTKDIERYLKMIGYIFYSYYFI